MHVSETLDGPWTLIKSGIFDDPRGHAGPNNYGKYERFDLDNAVIARYVNYSCTSYYGHGCALQYIGVFLGGMFFSLRALHG